MIRPMATRGPSLGPSLGPSPMVAFGTSCCRAALLFCCGMFFCLLAAIFASWGIFMVGRAGWPLSMVSGLHPVTLPLAMVLAGCLGRLVAEIEEQPESLNGFLALTLSFIGFAYLTWLDLHTAGGGLYSYWMPTGLHPLNNALVFALPLCGLFGAVVVYKLLKSV